MKYKSSVNYERKMTRLSPVICSVSRLPRAFSPAHPPVRGGGLSCLRACLRAQHDGALVQLTANVISPSPLLLSNDLAIVSSPSSATHANHPSYVTNDPNDGFHLIFDSRQ